KEAVQVEYLAAVMQQTGEDWRDVNLILSTAQPMLNAAPPDLHMLEVAVTPKGNAPNPMDMPANPAAQMENFKQAQGLRGQAAQEYGRNRDKSGGDLINKASALEQTNEFLWVQKEDLQKSRNQRAFREGQSVTYHLDMKLTVPSRNDEQVLEVTKIAM